MCEDTWHWSEQFKLLQPQFTAWCTCPYSFPTESSGGQKLWALLAWQTAPTQWPAQVQAESGVGGTVQTPELQ